MACGASYTDLLSVALKGVALLRHSGQCPCACLHHGLMCCLLGRVHK
jgi:hypothetical protein